MNRIEGVDFTGLSRAIDDACAEIDRLRALNAELLAGLKTAAFSYCAMKCPSVFSSPDAPLHSAECDAIRAAIARALDAQEPRTMTELALLNRYAAHLAVRLEECHVPDHLRPGLLAYFTERRPVGGFLQAALENNLRDAVLRADPLSLAGLAGVVEFLTYHAPAPAWGSPAAVAAWLADRAPVITPFDSVAAWLADRAPVPTPFD